MAENSYRTYRLVIDHPQLMLIMETLDSEARFLHGLSDTFTVGPEKAEKANELHRIANHLRTAIRTPAANG